jgi:AcrR family transcriptional regulator
MTPRRRPLDRQQIIDATLELADSQGLAAVSMRTIAGRLGVTPMALYRHVTDKRELLDGLVERLLLELPIPDRELPWEQRLRELAVGLRLIASRHPDVFLLLFARPAFTPAAVRPRDAVYDALRDAGIAEELVPRAERLLSTLVLGYAASEAGGRFSADESVRAGEEFEWAQELVFEQIRRLS